MKARVRQGESGADSRESYRLQKGMVIVLDTDPEAMDLKYIVTIMIVLAGITLLCGCTGSPQAPVATPGPVQAATTLLGSAAPGATESTFRTAALTWTTETPYEGHPYTKTFSFKGSGDYEDFTFSTDRDATWVFDLTYPKQGVFTVVLKDSRGDQLDVLANEGGGGNSRKTVFLKAGNYAFDVQADAPWYIMMTTG